MSFLTITGQIRTTFVRFGVVVAVTALCVVTATGSNLDVAASKHAAVMQTEAMPAGAGGHDMAVPGPDADMFEKQMYADMMRMMRDMRAPGYTGNRDLDFLAMMIPHHQGAIDMARLVLIDGTDPLTRSLAEKIIASQRTEINAMRGRLAALKARRNRQSKPEFPALSGTRGVGKQ